MNKIKRIRLSALLISASMTLSLLSGCAKDGNESVTESGTTTAASTSASQTVTAVSENNNEPVEVIDFPKLESAEIVSVTADVTEGKLISADTTFSIESRVDAEPEQLKKMIKITPDVPFELEKKAACRYTLRPLKAFEENIVAVISVHNGNGDTEYRWAFQTAGKFAVMDTYPYDGSDYAKVTTGIEIKFSAPVNAENADEYFEISPKVDGKFESHRSTLYFIPSQSLEAHTGYSVKLKKGFTSADGTALEEDLSFSFKTSSDGNNAYCYDMGMSETFIEGDPVVVEVYCSEGMRDNDYDVKMYRYNSADDYFNAMNGYLESGGHESNYIYSTDGLEEIYSSTDKVIPGRETWGPCFFALPENLEEGCYLVTISSKANGKEINIQRHIQVSPVSVYAATLSSKAQLFINNASTGNAVSGAEIELFTSDGTFTAKTDADGIATLDTPKDKYGTGIIKITDGANVYCDFFDYCEDCADIGDLYYTYLYTDREIYQREDTVKIWGAIIPRKKGVDIPFDLNLRFGSTYEEGWNIPLPLNSDGTFTTETSFSDVNYSWGTEVILSSGEDELFSKFIRINDYTKPSYTFETDVPVYAVSPQSVPVKASVNAQLFDGTAADGLNFSITGYDVKSASPSELVTNKNGYAESEILYNDVDSWKPQYLYTNFELTGVQNEYTDAYLCTYGFFRDIMLEGEFDEDSRTYNITTSTINYDKIESGDDTYTDEFYDKIRGKAANTEITATLYRSWSEKIESGTYYDFLRKENVTSYTYDYHTDPIGTYTVKTVNGKASLTDLPVTDKDSSYHFAFEWNDSQGRLTKDEDYFYNSCYYYGSEAGIRHYSFEAEAREFTENQQLELTLSNNGEPVKEEGGKVFLQTHGTSFIDYKIYDSVKFRHTMTADYIPNVDIIGAYFDGRHVYPIKSDWSFYSFNPEEREIKLEISTDKDKYAPAEKAVVTVKATDLSGEPVTFAPLILSVADEAVFAVANQTADPLNSIYRDIGLPYVEQYCSYVQHSLYADGAGEMGGGGDDGGARKNFKDTAAFIDSTTDENGQAVFEIDLPDNITEWRATAIAVRAKGSDVVYAGTAKHPIIVTQPLFLETVMLDEIVEGDEFTLSARCFGEHTGSETITATVSGNGVNETNTASAGEGINFGKLKQGEYTVTVTAENDSGKDAVELPLTVTDTLLETNVTAAGDLDKLDISPVSWPMSMTFFNKEYMLYTDVLFKLTEQAGDRLDMNIASAFAMKELGFITEEDYVQKFRNITPDGLANLMAASGGDPELTAKICAAAPELVDRTRVIYAMNDILNSKDSFSGHVSAAYLALAALGEPVMTEIQSVLEENTFSDTDSSAPFTLESGLRLTAALALLGDYDTALKYFEQFTLTAIEEADADGNLSLYISGGDLTALTQTALMTAAITNHPYADLMTRFLIGSQQVYDCFALELMVYLNHYSADPETDAVFTYNLDGKTETVTLDRHWGTRLKFGKEQFENADFKVTSGEVFVIANYNGHPSQNDTDPTLKVTKEISSDTGSFRPGSLVTVKINVSGSNNGYNYYTVTDVIPSCGRYDRVDGYYARRNGQLLTLYTNKYGVASYKFRIATSGEYVLESAAARNCDAQWGTSERTVISVE
ncbi:MAG: Ig-like domain-containing protein [Oscillospiraceae bacterium]|nr:Ig-like domain-containing protein [Oscillospiraceae bacterium]